MRIQNTDAMLFEQPNSIWHMIHTLVHYRSLLLFDNKLLHRHVYYLLTHLLPWSTSGLQYSIVPQNVENNFPFLRKEADPKSISLIWKCSFNMMFSSFISRCNIDKPWRYATASTTCQIVTYCMLFSNPKSKELCSSFMLYTSATFKKHISSLQIINIRIIFWKAVGRQVSPRTKTYRYIQPEHWPHSLDYYPTNWECAQLHRIIYNLLFKYT